MISPHAKNGRAMFILGYNTYAKRWSVRVLSAAGAVSGLGSRVLNKSKGMSRGEEKRCLRYVDRGSDEASW
jgi:hypothetical protein